MDRIENDKSNKTPIFNNDGSNTTSVIQEQSLNVPWDSINAACNYTNDLVANDNIFPVLHATAPMASFDGRIDLTMQSYYSTPSNEAQYNRSNTITEQVSIQNPIQPVIDTSSSLPDNSFNSPQIPINYYSEIFRFAIPGFQIILIPTSCPFADLNDFDMQYQFQQDQASSSYDSSQLYQDVSGVYETSGSGSSANIDQSQYLD